MVEGSTGRGDMCRASCEFRTHDNPIATSNIRNFTGTVVDQSTMYVPISNGTCSELQY